MNKTSAFLSVVIFIITAISTIAILNLSHENTALKSQIFSLSPGEKITYFELIDMNQQIVEATCLNKKKMTFIYIFSRPCSPCNRNIIYWKRMTEIMGDEAECTGIILGDFPQAYEFSQKNKTNFNLYVPSNLRKFLEKMKIRTNAAQTILVRGDIVERVIVGNIEGDSYTEILKLAKRIAKQN